MQCRTLRKLRRCIKPEACQGGAADRGEEGRSLASATRAEPDSLCSTIPPSTLTCSLHSLARVPRALLFAYVHDLPNVVCIVRADVGNDGIPIF